MTTPWLRSDDRLIAEKVEGLEVAHEPTAAAPDFYACWPPGKQVQWRQLYHYNLDLNSAIRAANHWSRQEPDHRGFYVGIDSCHDAGPEASFYDSTTGTRLVWWAQGESYAEAIARGLKKAITPTPALTP